MVTAVKVQGGFDTSGANVTDAVILSWVNAKYREMVARSKFLKASIDLGPTVAADATYDVPETVAEILALRVDGSAEYTRVGHEDMWALRAGSSALTSSDQTAYAPQFTAGGTAQVELYPTPGTAGLEISALVVSLPSALTTVPDTTPIVPADYHEAIVGAAIAMGLERQDGRFDLSAGFNAAFEAAIGLLKRRAVTRVGQGPVQFKVAGVHF